MQKTLFQKPSFLTKKISVRNQEVACNIAMEFVYNILIYRKLNNIKSNKCLKFTSATLASQI